MNTDAQKSAAAQQAAAMVENGMIVGLGTGSTASLVVQALGRRLGEGLRFTGVASSVETATLARSLRIPLTRLDELHRIDIDIDGADEVDASLSLIKGRGGALLREKLVAASAHRFVVVVDESKLVEELGQEAPVPVEVVPFGWTTTKHRLEGLGFSCTLRRTSHGVYVTNNHNYVLDCHAGAGMVVADPGTGDAIKRVTGVVEHGLFLGMASTVVVGRSDGVEVREASARR